MVGQRHDGACMRVPLGQRTRPLPPPALPHQAIWLDIPLLAQPLTRIFRSGVWVSHENALRPGMIGVADINHNPKVRRAFSWFKVAV